jgi:biopolymer transport protein ExbD
MAPMIDMVFLLLVFFMTVSTLAKDARPEIDLPLSTTAIVPEETPPRDIVTVTGSDSGPLLYWHNRQVALDDLAALLETAAEAGASLLLRGPPDLPWSAWEPVVSRCREAGHRDMEFATFED